MKKSEKEITRLLKIQKEFTWQYIYGKFKTEFDTMDFTTRMNIQMAVLNSPTPQQCANYEKEFTE